MPRIYFSSVYPSLVRRLHLRHDVSRHTSLVSPVFYQESIHFKRQPQPFWLISYLLPLPCDFQWPTRRFLQHRPLAWRAESAVPSDLLHEGRENLAPVGDAMPIRTTRGACRWSLSLCKRMHMYFLVYPISNWIQILGTPPCNGLPGDSPAFLFF